MTAAKITTATKIVSTACKVVSNAATFTQAAIGGVNNAKAIVKNMINGKLFSEDTAKNLVSFGINAFTAATSGKNLLSSSKELKKVVGDSVGSKWGKKAKKEPLLECNLQFFGKKNGCSSRKEALNQIKNDLGINKSQHPESQQMVMLLDEFNNPIVNNGKIIMSREMKYKVNNKTDGAGNFIEYVYIQDHSYGHKYSNGIGNQTAHFNVRPETNIKTGTVKGTKNHYYFNSEYNWKK